MNNNCHVEENCHMTQKDFCHPLPICHHCFHNNNACYAHTPPMKFSFVAKSDHECDDFEDNLIDLHTPVDLSFLYVKETC